MKTCLSRRKFNVMVLIGLMFGSGLSAYGLTPTAEQLDGLSKIRIGIIGDQTGSTNLAQSYSILQSGVTELNQQNVEIVLHVGDLLESSEDESQIRADYAQATTILDQLTAPWFISPGDHDVNPPGFVQDSSDRSREALFQELYSSRIPDIKNRLYYSFDIGAYHFISLYSHEALHADPRWGNIFLAQVTDAQFSWLANDLTIHQDAKAIIVFLHQPLWYNTSAWDRVHRLLSKHPVAAVISGHLHYDQDEELKDGIYYMTVGATGGRTKSGSRDAGDMHHVSVVEVFKKGLVKTNLISLVDSAPLTITPKVDMDKVQAIDVMLGELWSFASTNQVFVKDGMLVNDCSTTEPARIQITPLGNPTDKTAKVSIGFSTTDPSIYINSAGFAPNQCLSVINDYECELGRSSRVWISNFSSILLNSFAGPLWEASLGSDLQNPPQSGASLNFDIRVDYPGNSGSLFLETTASTTVASCL